MAVAAPIAIVPVPGLDGAAGGQAGAAASGDPLRGEKLFGRTGCNGCHQVGGIGGQVGPDLTRVIGLDLAKDRPGQKQLNVRAYIRESIENPQAYVVPGFPRPSPMPTFELSAQDVDDLMAYLQRAGQADTK